MAKLRSFPCPKCDRRFRMAAHLARHMNSAHGTSASDRDAVSRKGTKPGKWRQAISATGAAISGTFQDVVHSLVAARDRVTEERGRLTSQLESIGHALAALGHRSDVKSKAPSTGKSGTRRRAKRGTVTLATLRTLQTKGPIKPAALAQAAGVKPTTVSTALDTFRRKKLAVRSDAGWSLSATGKAELERRQTTGS